MPREGQRAPAVTTSLEWAGFHADEAQPYPQAFARGWDDVGIYLVCAGGGGGAAQLLPASLLQSLIDAACASVANQAPRPPEDELVDLFCKIDEAMGDVVGTDVYTGSSAEIVAVAANDDRLVVGTVGLGRAYLVQGRRLVQLTRDDSLFQDCIDAGTVPSSHFEEIIVATMNGRWREKRRSWRPVATSLDSGEGVLLATNPVHRAVPAERLGDWARAALNDADLSSGTATLWQRCREALALPSSADEVRRRFPLSHRPAVAALSEFDRQAAVALIRRRRP